MALDDSASTQQDTAVVIAVLANDSDVDGDTLSVTNVTTPSNGSVGKPYMPYAKPPPAPCRWSVRLISKGHATRDRSSVSVLICRSAVLTEMHWRMTSGWLSEFPFSDTASVVSTSGSFFAIFFFLT
jgi:hypothetical protein